MPGTSARAALSATRFRDLRWFAELGSTHDLAAGLARSGCPDGVVVVADHQTAGRGRRGRTWQAPPGSSLLVSVVLRPPWPPEAAHVATLAMALAAAEAVNEVAGVAVAIKWPNDLVVGSAVVGGPAPGDGRKLGGILAERLGDAVVVGLGLNVTWGSAPPRGGAALDELAGSPPVDRGALLVALLQQLDMRMGQAPEAVVRAAAGRSATLGRPVRVDLGGSVIEGTAVDLTPDGHLVVDTPAKGGRRTVSAGDVVHLRPA